MNRQLWEWLDAGDAVAALMGKADFFIPSVTWRTHDDLLVLRELKKWATDRGQVDAATEALKAAVLAHDSSEARLGLMWAAVLSDDSPDNPTLLDSAWGLPLAEDCAATTDNGIALKAELLARLRG